MKIKLREIGDFASLPIGSIIFDAEAGDNLCLYSLPKLRSTNGKIEYIMLSLVDPDGVFYTYEINYPVEHDLYLVLPDVIDCGKTKLISDTAKYISDVDVVK